MAFREACLACMSPSLSLFCWISSAEVGVLITRAGWIRLPDGRSESFRLFVAFCKTAAILVMRPLFMRRLYDELRVEATLACLARAGVGGTGGCGACGWAWTGGCCGVCAGCWATGLLPLSSFTISGAVFPYVLAILRTTGCPAHVPGAYGVDVVGNIGEESEI